MAERTEIDGVITPSPYKRDAPNKAEKTTTPLSFVEIVFAYKTFSF